jgi:anti-sigma regulatory factor (Ser/Thr protein kinase)
MKAVVPVGGVSIERALEIRADISGVQEASSWLQRAGDECGVPTEHLTRLDHCQDEALANIIMHGGDGIHAGPVILHFDVRRESGSCEAALTVSDTGIAFDPLGVKQKERPVSLDETEPGGLGLLMMRGNADRLNYYFNGGRNHLTFVVCWRESD